MNVPSPVIIVSIFGRGLWIAKSLIEKAIPVVWVDLSFKAGQLGRLDIEGPFPIIQSTRLSEQQLDFWLGNDKCKPLNSGLTFLTQRGPLELRSEFSGQRGLNLGLDEENFKYLEALSQPPIREKSRSKLTKLNLTESWLSHFAHQFMSLQDIPAARALSEGKACELLANLYCRQGRDWHKDLVALSEDSALLSVFNDVEVEDIAFGDRKTPSGLLLKKESSEVIKCSNLIWALGSAETQRISPRLAEVIFRSQQKEYNKIWMRWEVLVSGLSLPSYFVILDDPALPWEHQNLLVLSQHLEQPETYSCWMILPQAQRFNRGYLEQETAELNSFLEKRFPGAEISIKNPPLEFASTSRELGESLFGLFKEGEFQRQVLPRWNQFYQLAPENQNGQGPNGRLEKEEQISTEVKKWWAKELEIIAKKEARKKKRD